MLTYMYITCSFSYLFLQREISGVNGNVGHGQMWHIMQYKYNYCVERFPLYNYIKL